MKKYCITYTDEDEYTKFCHFDRNVFYEPRQITADKEEAEALAKELAELYPDIVYTLVELQ